MDDDFRSLSRIPHVRKTADLELPDVRTGFGKNFYGVFFQLFVKRLESPPIQFFDPADHGYDPVNASRRHKQPDGRPDTGCRRTNKFFNGKFFGQVVCVNGPGAAGGQQGVILDVFSSFGDMHLCGGRHVFIDDVVNPPNRFLNAEPRLSG